MNFINNNNNREKYLLHMAYDKDMVTKYIIQSRLLLLSGKKLQDIHKDIFFKKFREDNKICISDAQIVDSILNNNIHGEYWLSAYYDLPDKNKVDVGVLTFNLVK
jgi:hypothetical protein